MTAAEVMLWGTKIGTVVFNDETGLGPKVWVSGKLPRRKSLRMSGRALPDGVNLPNRQNSGKLWRSAFLSS